MPNAENNFIMSDILSFEIAQHVPLFVVLILGTIYLFTPDTICSISTTSKKTTSKLGNRLFFYLDYQ